jgi:hypothetical protein
VPGSLPLNSENEHLNVTPDLINTVYFCIPPDVNGILSDLDTTRGSGVPDFKKFSAYNKGPRSKEVDQILSSFKATVIDINFGRRTTH